MVRRGKAGQALNLVTIGSCFGGFISSVALLICAPLLAKIAKMVGQPEQMFVAIFGLSVVVMLSQDNLFKGLMVAFVSLLLATFGTGSGRGISEIYLWSFPADRRIFCSSGTDWYLLTSGSI